MLTEIAESVIVIFADVGLLAVGTSRPEVRLQVTW